MLWHAICSIMVRTKKTRQGRDRKKQFGLKLLKKKAIVLIRKYTKQIEHGGYHISYFAKKRNKKGFHADRAHDRRGHHRHPGCNRNPAVLRLQTRGYNTAAKADLKNAYTAAQAYFSDSPGATIDAAKLTLGGFVATAGVTVTPAAGST